MTGNFRRKNRFIDKDLVFGERRIVLSVQRGREIRFRYICAGMSLYQNAAGLLFS